METKYIWLLVLIFGIVAIIGIFYFINDVYIKSYWENKCELEKLSIEQNASLTAAQWTIWDICEDGRIDIVNENGTKIEIPLSEMCKTRGFG